MYIPKNLEHRADQQASLAKLMDPDRVLATIRARIQLAQARIEGSPTGIQLAASREEVGASDLNDYKNAVQELPTSGHEYWTTVAAIINYQSLLAQLAGEAPDPAAVSTPCAGLTVGTGGHVWITGFLIRNCVIDLDSIHDTFQNDTFKDSVIRYHGGPLKGYSTLVL